MNTPQRILRTSRRCLTGHLSLVTGGVAAFESSLERDWLQVLDFDPSVVSICVQPFTLDYLLEGKKRRYTPDIAVIRKGSTGTRTTVVYEVKPYDELKERWTEFRPRFLAAVHYCRERCAQFSIVTEKEIRTPFLTNAIFLRRYRTLPDQSVVTQQLLTTLRALGKTTPQALLAATFWAEETRMSALPILWRMVAHRVIEAPLTCRLTMTSPIQLSQN